jgi:hypothetical protein
MVNTPSFRRPQGKRLSFALISGMSSPAVRPNNAVGTAAATTQNKQDKMKHRAVRITKYLRRSLGITLCLQL